jgi:hypothetical protein
MSATAPSATSPRGNGRCSRHDNLMASADWVLALHPPKLNQRSPGRAWFDFLQPLRLTASLRRRDNTSFQEPTRDLLDVKGGLLKLFIRRLGPDATTAQRFRPIIRRCYATAAETTQTTEFIARNVGLFYGADGFPFQEPGTYEVTAELPLALLGEPAGTVARSAPLVVRILYPTNRAHDLLAMDWFTQEVGNLFVFGAPAWQKDALHNLMELYKIHAPDEAKGLEAQMGWLQEVAVHKGKKFDNEQDFATNPDYMEPIFDTAKNLIATSDA